MGTVERGAIFRAMQMEVAKMQGRHETIAEIAGRVSPCTVRQAPHDPADDEDEPTAGIHAPQDIHPHH
jgi:hypothetical protein